MVSGFSTPYSQVTAVKAKSFNDERSQALRDAGVSEHAGFPNPATDRAIQTLDLNTLLIRHSAATYLMRIEGNDWRTLGIFDGDIVIIDRALGYGPNDLVVWWQGENFTISHQNQVPEDTETWGVVSSTIHRFRKWDARI
jgi:SOS-response transcriptional repressor LexA